MHVYEHTPEEQVGVALATTVMHVPAHPPSDPPELLVDPAPLLPPAPLPDPLPLDPPPLLVPLPDELPVLLLLVLAPLEDPLVPPALPLLDPLPLDELKEEPLDPEADPPSMLALVEASGLTTISTTRPPQPSQPRAAQMRIR